MAILKSSKTMDAIELLKDDHRTVEELFASYESAKGSAKKHKIALKICDELNIHTRLEEEVFYPALKGKIDDDIIDEAYVEHDGAKALINELLAGTPDDEFYDAKVSVLSEQIEHHVKEEEQRGGMFSQAKKADVDLDALGAEMMLRKQEFLTQAKGNSLPEPEQTTMAA